MLLFWQFTIKTLEEIEFVSNQHIAIEMFLIRLVYLIEISDLSKKNKDNNFEAVSINQLDLSSTEKKNTEEEIFDKKNKTIGQIKNTIQEKKQTEKLVLDSIKQTNLKIKTFGELIDLCNSKKEIKLKYELETNVNLVNFENQRIEISFNEKLDKDFIKNLSTKLYEWTNDRWIISLSKKSGELSKKEKNIIEKKEILENKKKGKTYKKILEIFPDAELINIEENND